ncbi:MAG: GT4 family glycosyltransferase PelF [Spirochaetes bacterium]|nr:GT4 family glycosyltransferase PelF [Spirochaetota bacterium]
MPHVCMVIEGAYPYITGGVSAWCHQLISEIKDVSFTLLVILPASYRNKDYKYKLPDNITDVKEIWLDEDYFPKDSRLRKKSDRRDVFEEIENFHLSMKLKNYGFFRIIAGMMLNKYRKRITLADITKSKEAIHTLFNIYKKSGSRSGFMKYFWTWKSTHLPILRILNYDLPKADMYHAVSTGFAGCVAAIARMIYNIPYVLTEHGIYAMEREDELKLSRMIDSDQKQFWINFYHSLCRLSYSFADKIITLYKGNLYIELANNANADRLEIIPNGVDIELHSSLKKTPVPRKIIIGTVVRVVPIKDVMTFIFAARIAADAVKEAEFHIIGPTDEDEDYYNECKDLVNELGLNDRIIFTGKVRMTDYYPMIDILVLTSVREAQPLVLLEGMCVGMPCVATDVGCCREMLKDVGFITTPGRPDETAEAIIRLCNNKELREELKRKGREMVMLNYNVKNVIKSYRDIYLKFSSEIRKKRLEQYGRDWISAT